MQIGTAPLLEQLCIFHSRNVEETAAFLRAKDYRFDIPRGQSHQLDARLNGVYLPGVYLGYVQYGGATVALSPSPARTDTWLHLPLRGSLEASVGRESIACNPMLSYDHFADAREVPTGIGGRRQPHPTVADQRWTYSPACRPHRRVPDHASRLRARHRLDRWLRPQPGTLRAHGRRGPGTGRFGPLDPNDDERLRAIHHDSPAAVAPTQLQPCSSAAREGNCAAGCETRHRLHRSQSRPADHSHRPRRNDRGCRPNPLHALQEL